MLIIKSHFPQSLNSQGNNEFIFNISVLPQCEIFNFRFLILNLFIGMYFRLSLMFYIFK